MSLTKEALDALRLQLMPYAETSACPLALPEYCEFYQLDFAARIAGVAYRIGTVASGDYTLAVQFWQRQDATANLLLMHGYFDHTGLFTKAIEWALKSGNNVLMFDLPGHGLSSGEQASIDDFAQYSQTIDDVLASVALPELPLWAMGQSTGCAALMEYACNSATWPFQATVLLAPLVRPAAWQSIRWAHTLLRPFVKTIPREFSKNSSDWDFLDFVKADPLQSRKVSLRWITALRQWLDGLAHEDLGVGPALIIQGDEDGTVDWRYNIGVVEKLFPGSTTEYLSGAGHQLANESQAFRDLYFEKVRHYLAAQGLPQFAA